MKKFTDLQLQEPLLKAIEKLGFTEPTPIQKEAIPALFNNRDLVACAQTGSGKTLAYALPMISYLLENPDEKGLILVPTRELAKQVSDVIVSLTKFTADMRMALLVGGADMGRQFNAIKRKPRILVGTPGRIFDHLNRKSLSLKSASYLVLDEGDRMIDIGFAPQLDAILKYLPEKRLTSLFSATLPKKVKSVVDSYLHKPLYISVDGEDKPVEKIKQAVLEISNSGKNDTLLDQLNARKGSVIVFAKTKHRTNSVSKYLHEYGVSVSRIHGDRTQGQRNMAIKGFRDGTFRVLVATDVAARGLDVPHVAHVINYDLPMMDEDYIHRIGRTARAGADGEALSFVTPEEKRQWLRLAKKYKLPLLAGSSMDDPSYAPRRKARGKKNNFRNKSRGRGQGQRPRA